MEKRRTDAGMLPTSPGATTQQRHPRFRKPGGRHSRNRYPLHQSSRMAARLEEDSGVVNASWNLAAMVASGVIVVVWSGLRDHLFNSTHLACFSGWGSRKGDFATSLSLRLGTQSSGTLETRPPGAMRISGASRGSRRELAKDCCGRDVPSRLPLLVAWAVPDCPAMAL